MAEDPDGYLRELLRGKRLDQLAKAGGAAAVTAAVVSAVVEIALARVRNGSFAGVPWTEVASHAAKAAVSAAVIAIGVQSLSLGAQRALATGASGASGALAHGSLPFALMQGTWSIAGSGYGWATGKLDPGEAALMATESVARTTALWACSLVGQAAIPVPVVGAMIGGFVGQYGSTMMIQGVRLAVTARDAQKEWDSAYGLLLDQTQVIKRQAFEELEQLETIAAEYRTDFTTKVLPALERLQCGFWTEVPEQVLGDLAALTVTYAGTPLFTTLAEFDTFMRSSENVLTLKLK